MKYLQIIFKDITILFSISFFFFFEAHIFSDIVNIFFHKEVVYFFIKNTFHNGAKQSSIDGECSVWEWLVFIFAQDTF